MTEPHPIPETDRAVGGVHAAATGRESATPRDPEDAQRALAEVEDLLRRYEVVREQARHESASLDPERQVLVEQVAVAQHLAHLRARLDPLHPADVAYILEALPRDQRLIVWDLVKAERDGEILVEVSDAVRETLIASMDRDELLAAAGTLDTDDLAEIAEDLPEDVVEQVRRRLTPEEREQLRAAMSYPEESVGARMDFDLVTVREDVTLEVVLRYLRRFDELPDHTDQVFVVDRHDVLKGALPLDRLLINEPDVLVEDVMKRDLLSLQALDEAEEAAQAFERYDLITAPVVDARGRLIGRLTVDEVVDVIREQGESEVLSAAGLREEEDLFASIWNSAKNRWLWLAVNMCTAFFASRVIGAFEGTIEKVVALAALMPIVAGIAGNSGNQTMTLFIRSLALGQVTAGNAQRLFRKELLIALLNGLVWGGVAGSFAWLLYRSTPEGPMLGLVMMLAMVLNLLLAAIVGMGVPLMLERMKRDPAMGSSVLLTFSTDSMGFFIFLGLATLFFR
ncbi:MAG: magnesium transporter [Pseudomonadota bacterium]|jgi:magnesium transporter